MAIVAVIILSLALVIVSATLIGRAVSQTNLAASDRDWETAIAVAEQGVDEALVEIAKHKNWSTVADTTNLSTRDAVIAAAESLVASKPNSLESTPDGEYVLLRKPDGETVISVAAVPDWSNPNRKLRIIETLFSTGARTCWPEAAILGNALIETGNAQITTVPSTEHRAHVIGNGDFKGSSSLWVDGDIRVGGAITNTAPSNAYGVLESGATPLHFPSTGAITQWETDLIAAAQAGGTIPGINTSTAMTLDAPVYINGNVVLNTGARLTINGPGAVYVNGLFEMKGDSEVYNGSLLAVKSFFKQGGGTTYVLNGPATTAGLVTFYENNEAISFEGAATGTQGVLYAPRGGIKLTGSAALQGAAIAGGTGADGLIKFGGGATMTYPAGLLPSVEWLPEITGGPANCGIPPFAGFGDGAIYSNGDVKLGGGGFTSSTPSTKAHVVTNGSYSDSTSYVDGDVTAVGTISVGGQSGTATPGAQPYTFPAPAEIEDWRAGLEAAAKAGGLQSGASYSTDVAVNTPIYIDGDFTVTNGKTLTLTGGGVFYVKGDLTVSGGGTILNDGVIAVGGIAKVSGGGGYNVTGDPSLTLVVSFSTNQKALELSGGTVGVSQGPAFAPSGGILLSGSSTWRGSLIAGGTSVDRGVELSGGSSVTYAPGMNGNNVWLPRDDGAGAADSVQILSRREL